MRTHFFTKGEAFAVLLQAHDQVGLRYDGKTKLHGRPNQRFVSLDHEGTIVQMKVLYAKSFRAKRSFDL